MVPLNQTMVAIIIKFRMHVIPLVADVAQMYQQILIHPNDRKYQSILWNNQTYQLNTVTYSTASAPFLATRMLKQIAIENFERDPLASNALAKDTYVDDIVTSAFDIKSAINLQTSLYASLNAAGLHLRKWSSNTIDALCNIPAEDIEQNIAVKFKFDDIIKTLGICWRRDKDVFMFAFTPLLFHKQLSKRVILSDVSTVLDPLGLCAPIVI